MIPVFVLLTGEYKKYTYPLSVDIHFQYPFTTCCRYYSRYPRVRIFLYPL